MVESFNHMLRTSTYTKGNLGHREGRDLAHQCQREGIVADNPQEYQQGCSSSCLRSLIAAAKKSGHKEDGSKSKEGLLSNMGISVQNSQRNDTPPESSASQPSHLLPGCLPKREVSLCSRRGELRTPPPAWRSRFGSLPPQWLPLLAEEAPFPLPGLSMHGATLLLEKEAWPARGANPRPAAPSPCLASQRGSFGDLWKRG